MDLLFDMPEEYTEAVRLALNANVKPIMEIVSVMYDEGDELFVVLYKDPNDGILGEIVLENKFVFSCYKAVQEGITKWTG